MPALQRLGTLDRYRLEDRREPTIELNEEYVITVGKLDAALHLVLQHTELPPERRILGFKPALGLMVWPVPFQRTCRIADL
jgi:hypothetical protein